VTKGIGGAAAARAARDKQDEIGAERQGFGQTERAIGRRRQQQPRECRQTAPAPGSLNATRHRCCRLPAPSYRRRRFLQILPATGRAQALQFHFCSDIPKRAVIEDVSMITLYSFGPFFGLPDASPFVLKAMTLLELAGLRYVENHGGYARAPKGKLPYIEDEGTLIADSTFIRFHIEQKYGFDFDAGLSAEQRATGWAIEKMLEDHYYWALVHTRWIDDANFAGSAAQFFGAVPTLIRPLVKALVRRKIAASLKAQGMGRHCGREIAELARRDIDALATLLGDKRFLFGDKPCGADATAFAFVAESLSPEIASPLRAATLANANLVAYRDRMLSAYFPKFVA
jgi:glutathione S-transferase